MAKIGIIAAMDCEISMFIKDFHAKESPFPHIYHGACGEHDVYLTLSNIGKVNAAISTQRLIDCVKPDIIINSGVAGGITSTLKVCDLAISETLTYHDFHPIEFLAQHEPFQSVFIADKHLVELAVLAAKKECIEDKTFHYQTGMIVSGDIFVGDNATKEKLDEKYHCLCTEMEGAAVAHAATIAHIPFIVIRAISDHADDNANISFEQICNIAAERASRITKDIILHL